MKRFFFLLVLSVWLLNVDLNAQDTVRTFEPVSTAFIDDSLKINNTLDSALVAADTVSANKKTKKRHSAKRAAWMSAVLPGMGQVYNKRWWKVPIIYAGFAGLSYGLYHYGTNYTGYRKAYRLQVDEDSTTLGSFKGISEANELKAYRDSNKRNLDIMAVITAVWYALNIVDAAVDAHLFNWDVSDNLALDIHPYAPAFYNTANASFGLSLQFNFKTPNQKKIFTF